MKDNKQPEKWLWTLSEILFWGTLGFIIIYIGMVWH